MPPTVVFTANELQTYQPDLAARVEEEISDGAAASSEEGTLHCRITERRTDRAHIVVLLEGQANDTQDYDTVMRANLEALRKDRLAN